VTQAGRQLHEPPAKTSLKPGAGVSAIPTAVELLVVRAPACVERLLQLGHGVRVSAMEV